MTAAAAMSDNGDFIRRTEPYRRELLIYCYRMVGSVHDAEDVVQETYLRAWRGYGRFEGRSSVRAWLYQIATNACLRAIEQAGRRAMPADLGAPGGSPYDRLDRPAEVVWLQPLPTDPADAATARDGIRLAFVAALQHLPARQRAVLVLREVLALPAAEVARMLGTTAPAVNSALQRARAQLDRIAPAMDTIGEPDDPAVRALLDRYVTAFRRADLAELGHVLHDDVTLQMPPYATWFASRANVIEFFGARILDRPGRFRLVTSSANGQPAVAAYRREGRGEYAAHAIHVLDVSTTGVGSISAFLDAALFPSFGLPPMIPDGAADLIR